MPETSLACPNCRYNFFVHCPSCHELVDTTDARPGATDACQNCSAPVNRFELGQMYASSVKTTVIADPVEEKDAWIGAPNPALRRGFRLNLAWVVDLLWLLAIALVIWALTQLPAWFNLTGLYN